MYGWSKIWVRRSSQEGSVCQYYDCFSGELDDFGQCSQARREKNCMWFRTYNGEFDIDMAHKAGVRTKIWPHNRL